MAQRAAEYVTCHGVATAEIQGNPKSLHNKSYGTTPLPGEEIVISGISGQFPECENMNQFKESLLAGKDLLSPDTLRWKYTHSEIPGRTGKIKGLEKFDASFFRVHHKQAQSMDPMGRLLLERCYESIIDAGVNPTTLQGTRLGVYVGVSTAENEHKWLYEGAHASDFGLTGNARCMLANRISYWLGVHGPSMSVDTACSSSSTALHLAFEALRRGIVDSALVGGCTLILHPNVTLQFIRLGVLSPRAISQPFDEEGDGYVRSEAIAMVFLQRAKDARRAYAKVLYVGANCDGFKEQGITFPSRVLQASLMREVCLAAAVDPARVAYIEAHATGTKAGDPEEIGAIDEVYCKEPKRKGPLLIGSVKSNMGHSEAASGTSSLAKVIVAMETGLIPPSINYSKPRSEIPALMNGSVKVVKETTPLGGDVVAVSSFGFGGANVHSLLQVFPTAKARTEAETAPLPRLVLVSARTADGVEKMLGEAHRRARQHPGLVNLLHAIHETNIPGHVYRGVAVVDDASVAEEKQGTRNIVQHWSGEERPVWFVFAGMGCQWAGMGTQLMRIPLFAAAIERCHNVLAPKGLSIVNIITSEDPATFDNVLHSFVGIVAVQIGMVDILKAVGIEPDVIVGHSLGEICCGYADGCLTAEETILAAYSRGRASLDADKNAVNGAMAAVGMGAAQLAPLCPPELDIACHNSSNSATLSGPAPVLKEFVATLKAKGIFAKEVPCGDIAYHSRYIKPASELLRRYLKEVIPHPKRRSARWLSSSVPEEEWGSPEAELCSADYQANNQEKPVLMEPLLARVPAGAIVVEVAPHGLLQAILKRALPTDVIHVPMARREEDSLKNVLLAIGRLYNAGLQPRPAALYPPPQWPVPRGTPMLSPLVEWKHDKEWNVSIFHFDKIVTAEREVKLGALEDETRIWQGHIVGDRPLLPATGYLKLVWETFAGLSGRNFMKTAVVFEDSRFHRATRLPMNEGDIVTLMVNAQRGNGVWEISDSGTTVASGRIRLLDDDSQSEFSVQTALQPRAPRPAPDDALEGQEAASRPAMGEEPAEFDLNTKHIYKCLRLRGYNYQGAFRGIASASTDGLHARIHWINQWVPFLDAMLQMKLLSEDSNQLVVPTSIQKIVIDPNKFQEKMNMQENPALAEMQFFPYMDTVATVGVEVTGLAAAPIARRRALAVPVLERYDFVAYEEGVGDSWEWDAAARLCVETALENRSPISRASPPIRVAERTGAGRRPLAPALLAALADTPLVQAKGTVYVEPGVTIDTEEAAAVTVVEGAVRVYEEKDVDILVLNAGNVASVSANDLSRAAGHLSTQGVLLVLLPHGSKFDVATAKTGLRLAASFNLRSGDSLFYLKKGGWLVNPSELEVLRVPELAAADARGAKAFSWLAKLQAALKNSTSAEKRVILVARGSSNGALGLFKCLRAEPGLAPAIVRLYLLPEEADAEGASLDVLGAMGLRQRLELDLAVNVCQGGRWGSMRHLLLSDDAKIPVCHAYVNATTPGDLSSLSWIQSGLLTDRTIRKPDITLVRVQYASLNFKDILIASGKLNLRQSDNKWIYKKNNSGRCATNVLKEDCSLGLEFSGRLGNGRRVMGINMGGSIATELEVSSNLLWDIPETMSMKEAATIPVAYSTVVYALDMRGRMAAGESVLVHVASGAVGQAAINLALARGCRVFATVGTPEKREFLLRTFPQLDPEDVGNSRDAKFEELVMRRTNGRGVDLVLNSLVGELLQASVRCLGEGGRFLEIGKVDLINNSALGMSIFLKEASVHGITMKPVMYGEGPVLGELHSRVSDLLRKGVIRPVRPVQVYDRNRVEDAFRLMAAGKHIGKVLIAVREQESEFELTPSKPLTLPAKPRFYCNPEMSYVIVGGLGGVGLELADWLTIRGARHLVLSSRRGIATGYAALRVRRWRREGVRVVVRTDAVVTAQGAEALLRAANALAPVDAIFQLAVVLRDALFADQTPEAFAESFACKASATTHLDTASRSLCPHLRQFVIFSSVACGRGNVGQTNYGLSNAVMEQVARSRRAAGLPATAIQWGVVGDVGLVADMRDDDKQLEIGGTLQQSLANCLETVDIFLAQEWPVVSSMVVAEKKMGESGGGLSESVASLLGLGDLKSVSHQSTLAELGMDSMIAVEIQQLLSRDFDVLMAPKEVRSLTFTRIKEIEQLSSSKNDQPSSMSSNDAADANQEPSGVEVPLLGREGLSTVCEALVRQLQSPRALAKVASAGSSGGHVTVLFPGVEGVPYSLEMMSRGLDGEVAAVLLPFGNGHASIDALAIDLVPAVRNGLVAQCRDKDLIVVGYSFGGLLALEAVAHLEAESASTLRVAQLVLLDSAPQFIKQMVSLLAFNKFRTQDEMKSNKEFENLLQEKLTIHMLELTSIAKSSKRIQESVCEEITRLKDWQSRLEMFAEHSEAEYPKEMKMAALDAIYHRVLISYNYRWPERRAKLRTPVTLIRPAKSLVPPSLIKEDYGLSEICENPVQIVHVNDADHHSLPITPEITQVLNELQKTTPSKNSSFKQNVSGLVNHARS